MTINYQNSSSSPEMSLSKVIASLRHVSKVRIEIIHKIKAMKVIRITSRDNDFDYAQYCNYSVIFFLDLLCICNKQHQLACYQLLSLQEFLL